MIFRHNGIHIICSSGSNLQFYPGLKTSQTTFPQKELNVILPKTIDFFLQIFRNQRRSPSKFHKIYIICRSVNRIFKKAQGNPVIDQDGDPFLSWFKSLRRAVSVQKKSLITPHNLLYLSCFQVNVCWPLFSCHDKNSLSPFIVFLIHVLPFGKE